MFTLLPLKTFYVLLQLFTYAFTTAITNIFRNIANEVYFRIDCIWEFLYACTIQTTKINTLLHFCTYIFSLLFLQLKTFHSLLHWTTFVCILCNWQLYFFALLTLKRICKTIVLDAISQLVFAYTTAINNFLCTITIDNFIIHYCSCWLLYLLEWLTNYDGHFI